MFTGLIEEVGTIEGIRRGAHHAQLQLRGPKVREDLKIGDSVAVNGVCLTATALFPQGFSADVMHETLNRSSLGYLTAGSAVNLERAMPAEGRFGGHIVSGHIDGMGEIRRIERDENAVWFTIGAEQKLLRLVVEKGSITIDGISLTVAEVNADAFRVSIIPHTLRETILGVRKVGDKVNLETDIIGKYVARLLGQAEEAVGNDGSPTAGLSLQFLQENGF